MKKERMKLELATIAFKRIALIAAFALACTSVAWAQEEAVPGSTGSTAISLEDLANMQSLVAEKEDIVVHFVLPENWEVKEEGIDPATGKLAEELEQYTLLSRRPVADPNDPIDFVFELDIFEPRLEIELPANFDSLGSEDKNQAYEQASADALTAFLNMQMNVFLKAGMKCDTPVREIKAKPYGLEGGGRPMTYFVPIAYSVPPPPSGTPKMLYTFTSFTGNTVWQVKFLVSEDQLETYYGLIVLIMNNTFAVTAEAWEILKEQAKE